LLFRDFADFALLQNYLRGPTEGVVKHSGGIVMLSEGVRPGVDKPVHETCGC
jgi:hypothetical protein